MPPNAASNHHALMSSLKCYGADYQYLHDTIGALRKPYQSKTNQTKSVKANLPNLINPTKSNKQNYQNKSTKSKLLNEIY